jgi:UDPglucose 6-dehydrogenase/UDP-N-acetyl-D-galactosamine dehydrogenase
MRRGIERAIVCIIGTGYVGLPLAKAFSQKLKVIAFDIDVGRIDNLKRQSNSSKLTFTTKPTDIKKADFVIIAVPTPVTKSKNPDLSYITRAAKIIGQNMKKGSTVILESTVYPGVTEDIVTPILEKESGLECGRDFKIAYSPERINPGDEAHEISKVTKVVSGMDEETTELLAALYSKVANNIFKAKDIKTAEAAKVIENIQRDINIALMNELSLIFEKMDLSTKDILDAAATKWNFHQYSPGLVGGHCIPVDPYYLVYKAKELGYHPQVILAGRAINDFMSKHVAEITIKALSDMGKVIKGSKVLIMGLTYKENVPDIRETPVKEMVKDLKEFGVEIYGYDPLLDGIECEFGIRSVSDIENLKGIDCVIMTVAHQVFEKVTLEMLKSIMSSAPILIDVRGCLDKAKVERKGFYYRTL